MITQVVKHDYSAVKSTGQIPLCMIGDSITWAEYGDYWRRELLKHLPNLAFIGSHTACFGYSHVGEGGNNTSQVLARMDDIPECPNYNLLIGTNNNSVTGEKKVLPRARETAAAIIRIVNELLAKNGTEKVFLSSLLPCFTDNPLRDACNRETNKILRAEFAEVFPADKVVWVEYEKPIRRIENWEEKILLHPTPEGYAVIAEITAEAVKKALNIEPVEPVRTGDNLGVQVVNLMGGDGTSICPVIAGWYTLSCKVDSVDGKKAKVALRGLNHELETPLNLEIPVKAGCKKLTKRFFTEAEGYGYTRDKLVLEVENCVISDILLEKMRPSRQASVYNNSKSYIDTVSPFSNGELLEYKK